MANTNDAFWSGGQKGQHQAPVMPSTNAVIPIAPTGPTLGGGAAGGGSSSGGGGGGGGGGYSAQAAANAAAKSAARRENENTASLAQGQYDLLGGFGKARDTKLANIAAALKAGQDLLMKNYGIALGGLEKSTVDNEASQGDASFSNIANAIRERAGIMDQASSLGAGESDLIRAQLAALRNYNANQGEVNRSYFDTVRSINNSINSLNSDTASNRMNLFNNAESDREAAWANYYNQTADTWTQIQNIENANSNVNSDTSEAYNKRFGNAAAEAAAAAGGAYKKAAPGADITDWSGKGQAKEGSVSSSNRAASVNLGGPQKAPEGATLRRGF